MPQIKITISQEEYNLLKRQAEVHLNSISKEARVTLRQGLLLSQPQSQPQQFIPHNTPDGLQTQSSTPENPTGQSHTPTANTTRQPDFQTLATQILGHHLDMDDCYLMPDNNYYEYARPVADHTYRFPDTMPYDKQIEYLEEYKHYE